MRTIHVSDIVECPVGVKSPLLEVTVLRAFDDYSYVESPDKPQVHSGFCPIGRNFLERLWLISY